MFDDVLSFFDRHQSFIVTTHDSPDADAVGSELVMASILKKTGKDFKIINGDPIPASLGFIENTSILEKWDNEKHSALLENSAMLILDTSEEFHIGSMRKVINKVRETFVFDHHEPKPRSRLSGFIDPTAASTAEMAVALACQLGIDLDSQTAAAAYAAIVSDSGFFSYPKTNIRTFKAAMRTLEWGANPNQIYKELVENSSSAALLLQKQALLNLEFHADRKIAVLTLRRNDFESTGADYEDADHIVNIPLKSKEIEVSLLLKEKSAGEVRCSLRSKGKVNVSKIAQEFGGGGHVTAAGFKCSSSMEETIKKLTAVIEDRLNGV